MRVTSTLLSGLSRSVSDSLPDDGDTSLVLPPFLFNTIESPFPLRIAAASQIQTDSHFTSQETTVTNGVSAYTTITTLVPGLWDLRFQGAYGSDWAIPGFNAFALVLRPPTMDNFILWLRYTALPAAAFTNHFEYYTRVLLPPADQATRNWDVRSNTPGSGAAQTNRFWVNLTANRLL